MGFVNHTKSCGIVHPLIRGLVKKIDEIRLPLFLSEQKCRYYKIGADRSGMIIR